MTVNYEALKHAGLGLFFTFLILFALFGNLLVTVAICVDKKLRKPENYFLVSLAVSDMLVAVLVMTFAAVNDILGYWVFGGYCEFWICSDVMLSTASILNLCAISFDRYWHIRHPLRYCITMSNNKIISIIIGVWVVSISISSFPFTWSEARNITAQKHANNTPGDICLLELGPTYTVVSSLISFFLPCTLMIVSYSKLYFTARRHIMLARQQYKCVTSLLLMTAPTAWRSVRGNGLSVTSIKSSSGSGGNNNQPSSPGDTGGGGSAAGDNKARRTIGIIMGVFILCWLPFFCINILRAFAPLIVPIWVFQSVTWIGYGNSIANPVIYGIFSRDFRRAFKRILCCESYRRKKKSRCGIRSPSTQMSFIERSPAAFSATMGSIYIRKRSSSMRNRYTKPAVGMVDNGDSTLKVPTSQHFVPHLTSHASTSVLAGSNPSYGACMV